tara:strand:- start:1188 stop:1616 length:429 start_codon:yes stop_codon:yes gene_type:complete
LSIIYDALKKSQRARAGKVSLKVAHLKQDKRKQVILMLLILTCLFVIVATLTLTNETSFSKQLLGQKKLPIQHAPRALAIKQPTLLLEGVFLSDNERLAMINHQSYHEGDKINGMQIVSIAFDQVTLQNKKRSMILRSNLTQ